MAAATWRGTDREYERLQRTVARNCECVSGMLGLPPLTCAPHQILENQTILDHLLYVYRTRRVFIAREFYAFPLTSSRRKKLPAV
jgi:hypothetical protein